MSSHSKARPSKVVKGGTVSSRNYRFESFTQRIAKINIDPVRRVRCQDLGEQDASATASYFKTSLEEWIDLNLSENFTDFARSAKPLCESLPQLLHYQHRLMDLMTDYIGKMDVHSLEPLLSLLGHFAHDLGPRFEPHFQRAVTLVASVAAKHTNVEVIEWSFSCLAWLFKYLSRLLVPDLRPLYDILVPLLGKEHKKLYVVRFAAEALSFLVRKAGALYHKNPKPLEYLVRHSFEDIRHVNPGRSVHSYQHGLMTMFAGAVKGVKRGLHSSGGAVIRSLLDNVLEEIQVQNSRAEEVVCGVLISLIHHIDMEGFQPLWETVLQGMQGIFLRPNPSNLAFGGRLLFIMSGVRKGSRVQCWQPMLETLERLLNATTALPLDSLDDAAIEIIPAAAVILQSAPMDAVIPHLRKIMVVVSDERFTKHFFILCSCFAQMCTERFPSILLPHLQKIINSHWAYNEDQLCVLLPKLSSLGCLTPLSSSGGRLLCPTAWQHKIGNMFAAELENDELVPKCCAYLDLIDSLPFDKSLHETITGHLGQHAENCLSSASQDVRKNSILFGVGRGLRSYVTALRNVRDLDASLWQNVCSSAPSYKALPPYLESLLGYITALSERLDYSTGIVQALEDALISNLTTPSHSLRALSLRILGEIYQQRQQRESEAIAIAIRIEDMPLTLETARSAAMYIRKLGALYSSTVSDTRLRKIIPYYCFGILTMPLSQIWVDAKNALKLVCENKIGEEVFTEVAFSLLAQQTTRETSITASPPKATEKLGLTEFQCSNLASLDGILQQNRKELNCAKDVIREAFHEAHRSPPLTTSTTRAQVLDVLSVVPQVAEKRSRHLVPLLISWTGNKDDDVVSPPEDTLCESGTPVNINHNKWTLREKKAMLGLFQQFINPSVLYKSGDVYQTLLDLLTNGDVEIQKYALKVIFTWKHTALCPYEENLLNLLDEARFREELTLLTHTDENLGIVRIEDRKTLMPVLLRLLYGRSVAKAGSVGGNKGQDSKRKAVVKALASFEDQEVGLFLQIVLGPLGSISLVSGDEFSEKPLEQEHMSVRKQVGLIKMLVNILETLGNRLESFVKPLLNALLYCLVRAARALSKATAGHDGDVGDDMPLSMLRVVRQTGLKCLNLLFRNFPGFHWQDYISLIMTELIFPRIDKLPIDTAQAVSVTLQIFSTWASMQETVLFLAIGEGKVLYSIAECLSIPSAKDEVKTFVLENIVSNIITLANEQMDLDQVGPPNKLRERIRSEILQPNIDYFLTHIGDLIRKSPSRELLGSGVQVISELADFVTVSSQARNLVEIAAFLLEQPLHRVNPRTKSNLLRILQRFIPQCNICKDIDLQSKLFSTVSSLFGYFRDHTSRETLCHVVEVLAQDDHEISGVGEICADLNSFSPHSLEGPDFDRRLRAFALINEEQHSKFNIKQWRPIMFNMLYFVKDEEELAIRTNASLTLRRFIRSIFTNPGSVSPEALELVRVHLLPSLRKGALESSELVRAEYLAVMASLVKQSNDWAEVSDMRILLADDDEEASFFNNILHIQQHRRLRTLRRLAGEARQARLSSTNISQFFVPLIEHFIFNKAEEDNAHNLAAETILTIGSLAECLEWPQFRAMFRRYSGYIQSKPEMEKSIIKLLGTLIDALSRAAQAKLNISSSQATLENSAVFAGSANPDVETGFVPLQARLALTIPQQQKLSDDLTRNLVPPLITYLHNKDESTVSLRIPVAVAIVKLLKLLPDEQLSHSLPPVLTDLCHILRSRSQDSRDLTRKTLAEIAALTGPSCFGFMLKELRGALARGYQLHVLSYTVHSILVATASSFRLGDLDYCLPQIVAIIMDDIFGLTGQEKDAEEYISKMKEVKSSKSYDSMELIAKTTTIRRLSDLLRPLQSLLQEKLTLKLVKKIEELLRRIGVGLLRNEAIQSRDLLVFCYEIIQEAYKSGAALGPHSGKEDYRTKRYLINLKGANKDEQRGSTSSYTYKLARFSLDVLRSALHKYDALQTPSNLVGFLPIIGDGITQSQEELQTSAIRLLTTIIKMPLPELDQTATVAAAESVKIIKGSTSTNSEGAQAALKLISAILRERRHVAIRESDLAYLLKKLKPDLEEPNRQGVTFNFLKALLTRKIVITEVYEVLDTVAAIMVTNQTRGVRDLARGVYFQFLLEYPQSRERFSKQLVFLVKNLEYQHQEGRQSVMETFHLLLTKVGSELTQDVIVTAFVPLVMVLINDDSAECREMAGALLGKLFERADEERTQTFLSLLRTWLSQNEQPLLTRAALQIYQMYFDVSGAKSVEDKSLVQTKLVYILTSNAAAGEGGDWELVYFALQNTTTLCKLFPETLFIVESAPLWMQVQLCLSFPHAWVKLSAAKLLGLYIADFGRANAETGLGTLPLTGTSGLKLTSRDILQLTRVSVRILGVPGVSEDLAAQTVRNLLFLGRCMGATKLLWSTSSKQEEPSEAEGDSGDEDKASNDGYVGIKDSKLAIQYLFERLSAIVRRETVTTRAPALVSKTASLQLTAALCSHLAPSALFPSLQTILLPLYHLTDLSIPTPYSSDEAFTTAYKALVSTSQEIMALLQKRLGTTEFVGELAKVREGVKTRREQRRIKRRIEAVAEPEKVGRDKKRKGEKKREKRKERSGEERGRRRGW